MDNSTVERRNPIMVSRHRSWAATPAVLAGVLTVICVGIGLSVDRFDAAHPSRTQLMYALDTDTGQARWLSGESVVNPWTSQYVTGTENVAEVFPVLVRPGHPELRAGPAAAASLAAPALTVSSDATADGHRTLVFTVQPRRAVRLVYLGVQTDATLTKAIVANREVLVDRAAPFSFIFHAPPVDGVQVRLTLDGSAPVKVRVMDGSDGLDGLPGFKPRPPGVGVEGSHDSELVVVAKTYTL